MNPFEDRYRRRLAAHFDGEAPLEARDAARLERDAGAQGYRRAIETARAHAARTRAVPGIADAQFAAFFDGIRAGIEAPAPAASHRGAWAMASLTAAALVLAGSLFVILRGTPAPVQANEVESVSSDLEGVTIDVYDSPDGTTIWLNDGGNDL